MLENVATPTEAVDMCNAVAEQYGTNHYCTNAADIDRVRAALADATTSRVLFDQNRLVGLRKAVYNSCQHCICD